MKAVIISNTKKPEGKQAAQHCRSLKARSPWLQMECVDATDSAAKRRYHLGSDKRTSFIILDDADREIIRGKGVVPEKYLTQLLHEIKSA